MWQQTLPDTYRDLREQQAGRDPLQTFTRWWVSTDINEIERAVKHIIEACRTSTCIKIEQVLSDMKQTQRAHTRSINHGHG